MCITLLTQIFFLVLFDKDMENVNVRVLMDVKKTTLVVTFYVCFIISLTIA